MFNIWLAGKKFVIGKLEWSDIDRIDTIYKSNRLSAGLDSRDGAKRNNLVVRASNFGASTVREEFFARGNNATVGAPDVLDDWRNDAIVHMTRYKIVKFI